MFLLGGDLNCMRMPGLAAVFDFIRSAESAGYIALPADTDKGTIQITIGLFLIIFLYNYWMYSFFTFVNYISFLVFIQSTLVYYRVFMLE